MCTEKESPFFTDGEFATVSFLSTPSTILLLRRVEGVAPVPAVSTTRASEDREKVAAAEEASTRERSMAKEAE